MKYNIRAYETRYGGTLFRSRLEARWAAFFDLMEWRWEYEPLDLKGWVPDFYLFDCYPSTSDPVPVEVEPFPALFSAAYRLVAEAQAVAEKAAASAPSGFLLLGACMQRVVFAEGAEDGIGAIAAPDETRGDRVTLALGADPRTVWRARPRARFVLAPAGSGSEQPDAVSQLWSRAGNATRWKPRGAR